MRNAVFGGKEGHVECFSEQKNVVSYKLFLKKIPNQKVCCAFWASVLEFFSPASLFCNTTTTTPPLPHHPKHILAEIFQAVRQKDKEKEEMLGKRLFDSSSPFP